MAQSERWQQGGAICIHHAAIDIYVMLAYCPAYCVRAQSSDQPDGTTSAILIYNKNERSMLLFGTYQITSTNAE